VLDQQQANMENDSATLADLDAVLGDPPGAVGDPDDLAFEVAATAAARV
jgi:hypothetical protein